MVTQICELPPTYVNYLKYIVAITFGIAADWKMGATPPKTNFKQVVDPLPGFESYTFINFQKKIFITPPHCIVVAFVIKNFALLFLVEIRKFSISIE